MSIWHDFLYQPLFNFLIWVYNNWTDQNLGWAVVYLTIILRVVLLPFTLITERNSVKNEELGQEVLQAQKAFHNDSVLRKEEIRRIMKTKKVSPWSKVVVLGTQILVLVLLYQVFLRGITGEKVLKILYKWVDFPGKINTDFFGFDLGERHTWVWPALVALFLIVEIYSDYRRKKMIITKNEMWYFLLFPIFSFIALWWLPMVKSLFILTTMTFSVIIHQISKLLFGSHKPTEESAAHH